MPGAIAHSDATRNSTLDAERSVSYGLDSVWDPIAGADRAVARDRGQHPMHAVAATRKLQKHLV